MIGYVRFVQESREIYNEIFSKLLVAWSSYTSFTNTSYDQHLFLTKCVLISYSFLDENDRKIFTQSTINMEYINKKITKNLLRIAEIFA